MSYMNSVDKDLMFIALLIE